jgi:hypothetical protein
MGGLMKRRLVLLAALLAAFSGGWGGGAYGRGESNRALRAALAQNDLLEARAALFHARVSLYEGDLIEVTRQLEDARAFVEHATPHLGAAGAARPLDLEAAAAQIDDAKRLVVTLATETRTASVR